MSDEPGDSDLRKRAAWLLGMLALVAVLFVVLLTTLLKSDGKGHDQAGPDDSLGPTSQSTQSSQSSSAPDSQSSTSGSTSASTSPPARTSCPTKSVCALDGDIGDAVGAINDYRQRNDQQPVPGSVSAAAKKCAQGNGSNCSGGWAESQVDKPVGATVVAKISKRAKLLDPSLKSFEVGWAYDPQAKQYYFAVIRND